MTTVVRHVSWCAALRALAGRLYVSPHRTTAIADSATADLVSDAARSLLVASSALENRGGGAEWSSALRLCDVFLPASSNVQQEQNVTRGSGYGGEEQHWRA